MPTHLQQITPAIDGSMEEHHSQGGFACLPRTDGSSITSFRCRSTGGFTKGDFASFCSIPSSQHLISATMHIRPMAVIASLALVFLLPLHVGANRWHFRIRFYRYSDGACKQKYKHVDSIKAGQCTLGMLYTLLQTSQTASLTSYRTGHCKSFDKPFTSYAYEFVKHVGWEKDWEK